MERPEFKVSSLVALVVASFIVGALGGIVVGGLADNTPAGWSFFALTVSHIVAGGLAIILTHDIENN
jgi:outer membrane lipoprotein SlyB